MSLTIHVQIISISIHYTYSTFKNIVDKETPKTMIFLQSNA